MPETLTISGPVKQQLVLWPEEMLAAEEAKALKPGACRYWSGNFFEQASYDELRRRAVAVDTLRGRL